ncbi:hypothetical protein [Streptomyces sp. NRRL S-87]|uniref:hypothetical protein n=1 Tax=Streptomyces sp. NRRL S-87 TaxID=1463920 RepID=UPI00056429DC|nr:hypothetical protein [Streptomyces sp. NRRL S-87]
MSTATFTPVQGGRPRGAAAIPTDIESTHDDHSGTGAQHARTARTRTHQGRTHHSRTYPRTHGRTHGRTHTTRAASEAEALTRSGGFLHAARVFATTAVSVVLLGEYSEDAGVIRR